MKKITVILALLISSAAGPVFGQAAADQEAIKRTALNYAEGWYEGDAAKMESALSPDLAKRIVRTNAQGRSGLDQMTAMSLVIGTRGGYGKETPKADQQKDVNYRESSWGDRGGFTAANELNRRLLENADVVFGVEAFSPGFAEYSRENFGQAAVRMCQRYPNLKLVVTILRDVNSASRHDIGGVCYSVADRSVHEARGFRSVDVVDRVGSGDAFAAGLIHGVLSEKNLDKSIGDGVAAAVLAVASPGDGLYATSDEVEKLAGGTGSHAVR